MKHLRLERHDIGHVTRVDEAFKTCKTWHDVTRVDEAFKTCKT